MYILVTFLLQCNGSSNDRRLGIPGESKEYTCLPRPRRRLSHLLYTAGAEPPQNYRDAWVEATHEWELRFLRSPVEVIQRSNSAQMEGLYCSGWIGQGPIFVILGTMNDSFATAKVVLHDIVEGRAINKNAGGREQILPMLQQRGVKPVRFHQWEKVDKVETVLGAERGKPREKITSLQEMLQIAWSPV
nr:hypothetical protein BaRGS_026887 [Batillaria attramentaria]